MSDVERAPAKTPPFQLRPNKFVDRMMFLDLISRSISERGADDYLYISMGATFLHDHHEVYRRLGIRKLISFGNDPDDIKRQEFNRPTDSMQCVILDSGDLPDNLAEIRGTDPIIVWLDYMSSKDRRKQLQEVEQVLRLLSPGDVFRVTLNAEYRKFGALDEVARKEHGSLGKMVAAKLNEQLGDYLPANLSTVSQGDLPELLADAIGLAAERARTHLPDVKFIPILSTTYADGDRMVTVACAVRGKADPLLPRALRRWRYRSKDWSDFRRIDVPDLSLREKHHIDRRLKYSASRILKNLPFRPENEKTAKQLRATIESYKLFHRYYPAFHHIDH